MSPIGDFVQHFRRLAVLGVQVAFMAGALFALLTFIEYPQVVAMTGASIAVSLVSFALAWAGRVPLAATLLALQFVALPFPLAWIGKGTYDVVMLMVPAGIVTIGLLETPRRTAVFALLTVLGTLAIAWATTQGWSSPSTSAAFLAAAQREAPIAVVVISFAAGVGLLVSTAFDRLVRAVTTSNETLEAAVALRTRELSDANAELRAAMATVEQSTRELVRSEKLAALGGVVAGVTHELNTPIGNALLAASALEDDVNELKRKMASGALKRSEFDGFVEQATHLGSLIARSLQRANELTRSFKRVAVDQASERRREFAVDETLRDLVRTLTPALGPSAPSITLALADDVTMDSYPGALGQVVGNLLQNAALHAFDVPSNGQLRVRSRALDEDRVEIIVEDDGRGIPEALRDEVFRPFFTTRAERGGSGLGLSICRSLVAAPLGGSLDLDSAEGRGTRFILRLPRVAPAEGAH